MELRLLLLLCCCLAALQELNALDQNALKKRAVNEYSSNHKHAEEVEGSGGGPPASSYDVKKKNLAAADIEWEASGIGPDDEDGDVVEGSGDDEVHGSGDGPPPVRIPPVVIQHTTTTATQPPAVNVHDVIRRPPSQEDVHIEEQAPPSVRTTPSRGTYPEMTTVHTPPPSIFEGEQRHATIDTLLKPGILAAIIGGFVVGILAAILLVMFLVYRMRKKDEGSYALDEPKQPPHYSYAYQKAPTKEFYA